LAWVIAWTGSRGRAGVGRIKYSEEQARKIAHDLNWDHKPYVTYKAVDENKVSQLYVIGWKVKGRLRTGSVALTREYAESEVQRLNRRFPQMVHVAVPADVDI
jgi:hypothetical protein